MLPRMMRTAEITRITRNEKGYHLMMLMPTKCFDSALEEYGEALRTLREKLDRALYRGEVALAPTMLAAYGRIQRAIVHHGTFDLRTREAIALTVAAVRNCTDCHFTRTVACHAAGWTREQTVALRTGEQIVDEPEITALTAVARQAAGHAGEVDEDTWQQALRTGWTIEELAELFTHVIANVFTGYFNHYARAEVGIPAVPGVEEAAA
jgi:alkylhydroperoxidase/carboxymuconolactone decarboxylase family protein YurZ